MNARSISAGRHGTCMTRKTSPKSHWRVGRSMHCLSFDEKSRTVLVQKTAESAHDRYNIIQVKPFMEPETAATNYLSALNNCFSVFASPHVSEDVNITEIVHKNDPRANSAPMRTVIISEFQDLLRRGTLCKWDSNSTRNDPVNKSFAHNLFFTECHLFEINSPPTHCKYLN